MKVVLVPLTLEHGNEIDYWIQRYVNGQFKTNGVGLVV